MATTFEDCACPLEDPGPPLTSSQFCGNAFLFMVILESYLKSRCSITQPCKRVKPIEEVETEYDFIVVGAGVAGSIVAGRLSENKNFNVLLIEAGGQEPIGSRVPSFIKSYWSHDQVDWQYRTVPDDYCLDQDGKGCSWPRGKVLGGTNILNGMKYHRGHPADYEDWVQNGANGWSWEENLPFFDMTEGNQEIGSMVSDRYHSNLGPLPIQRFSYQPPFMHNLMEAVEEAGLPIITDINDPNTPEGFGIAQVSTMNGQRYTTARAFLKPKSERPNLSIKLNAHVTKVLMRGRRAIGVEFIEKNGDKKAVHAKKEVILSGGALNTPQTLMLSGIGPRETLEKFNIPVVADLPVGQNLRNHLGVTLRFNLTSMNNTQMLDWNVLNEYLTSGTGPMASNGLNQLAGHLYSSLADRTRKQPDLIFVFSGFLADCSRTGKPGEILGKENPMGYSLSVAAYTVLPRSVGYMTLNSTDPLDPPLFYPKYFSHPDDMILIKDSIKYLRKILETKMLQNKYGITLDTDHIAGCSDSGEVWSDEWMECMIRLHTDPQNHQLGTASIGKVIDTNLRVYNIKGLRVIDASSMPTQPSGNIQGPVMMVAERGAMFIKNDWQ